MYPLSVVLLLRPHLLFKRPQGRLGPLNFFNYDLTYGLNGYI